MVSPKEIQFEDEKLNKYLRSVDSIRNRYAKAIGRFLMAFNVLESTLGETVLQSCLWETDDLSRISHDSEHTRVSNILASELTLLEMLDVAHAISMKFLTDEELELLKFLFSKVRNLNEYRNGIVHSRWGATLGGDLKNIIRQRRIKIRGNRGLRYIDAFPHIYEIYKREKELIFLQTAVIVLEIIIAHARKGERFHVDRYFFDELKGRYGEEAPKEFGRKAD